MRNMATASVTAASFSCRHSILWIAVALLGFVHNVSCYVPTIDVTCKTMVDLKANGYSAGLIVSRLPPRIPIYSNEDERCDIYISMPVGFEMMFYFNWLDLYSTDLTRCESANIQLFDGSPSEPIDGLNRPICGREEEMPTGVYFAYNRFLIIRVNALGVIQGSGFEIHFTIYRLAFPCSRDEFACETFGSRRCISAELVCDDWNDCGDWVDEQQDCNNLTPGGIAAIVLVCVGLVTLIVGLIIFCKIRRQREMKMLSEKEAAMMRQSNSVSSRGGFISPLSISNETLEREKYVPRYNTGRNSVRRSQTPGGQNYEERPPPYVEKPRYDDSRSEEGVYEDQEPPRRKSQNRTSADPDDVFEEEPRTRRGRTRSQERPPSREDRYPPRRDDQDYPPDDRHSRYPPREDRYSRPARHDERDSPRSQDHYPNDRDREERAPPREDPSRRYDDRNRDRYPSQPDDRERERDRDRDRERERDRDSRRNRPQSYHDEDDMMDQLHPLREQKRRSMYTDSDPDISRDERRTPDRDRSRDEDRYPPHAGRDDPYAPRDDRRATRDRDPREDRPSRDRNSRPPPEENSEDSPPRRRRRRSRSREDPDRLNSSRDDRGENRGGRGRPSSDAAPEEPRRSRVSHGGFREEAV